MLTRSQHARLHRKCVSALERAVERFPGLLEESDSEAAAAIIADLIKAQLALPEPEADPQAALNEIIARIDQE